MQFITSTQFIFAIAYFYEFNNPLSSTGVHYPDFFIRTINLPLTHNKSISARITSNLNKIFGLVYPRRSTVTKYR